MHTNSTPNYNLPQFVSTDKPTWLGDVNGAMSAIDTAVAGVNSTATGADSKADNAVTTANTAATTAGNAATLAETANTNANSALTTAGNAATAAQAAQSTAEAASTAATAAQGAVSTLSGNVGDLTDLTTTAKNTIVAAINEVNAKPSGSGDAEDITYDNTTSGLTATNVQAAIDELKTLIQPFGVQYSFQVPSSNLLKVFKNGVLETTLANPSPSTWQDTLISINRTVPSTTGHWIIKVKVNCTVDGVAKTANETIFDMEENTVATNSGYVVPAPTV